MWVPKDVQAIEKAIASGALEETSSFDGKRQLPEAKKNASAAVDIAAMTTAGGALLYGVSEDEHERLTVRSPIPLAGAADRLDMIVQTSIAEVPHVQYRPYPLLDDPAHGYLLVLVPPSPRAPHQVTVKNDRRFYGRGEKGNRLLSEAEVAALYARRQQQEVNLHARLNEVIQSSPYAPSEPDTGVLYAFAQPVPPDQSLWDRAEDAAGTRGDLQERINAAAMAAARATKGRSGFSSLVHWYAEGADAFRIASEPGDPPAPVTFDFLTNVSVNIDGRAVLYAPGMAERVPENANDTDPVKLIFEATIAGSLGAFFAATAALYESASYFGAVDVGVAVTGLHGGIGSAQLENTSMPAFIARKHMTPYRAETYTRVARLSAASELADYKAITMRLVGRLLAATSLREAYTPFVP